MQEFLLGYLIGSAAVNSTLLTLCLVLYILRSGPDA